jgi:hypothetical protein
MGNSSVEREDKIVTEVLVVLGELGRDDLVGGLGGVVGDLGNRIVGLSQTINILEGVINNEK